MRWYTCPPTAPRSFKYRRSFRRCGMVKLSYHSTTVALSWVPV